METIKNEEFTLLLIILKQKGLVSDSEIDWISRAGEVLGEFGKGKNRTFKSVEQADLVKIATEAATKDFGDYISAKVALPEEPKP